ncbi:MAG: YifB family Mg chelatase-like AAA ATPase [Alphaproteobacteria bacterium]|nr:YifB family Mg chelatase-like AAA ATPase [Alphaproteobacteria bacterium]MBL0718066.1 YifB family Mg chelatase-like AAA ATPase [Alphaproteobacteria bacterium]
MTSLNTICFNGLEAQQIKVQVQISNGLPNFTIVGLADKTVSEARERIRGAFNSMGLALPPKRIVVNLSPADVYKEGAHFDLPIACALLVVLGIIPEDLVQNYFILGELSLDNKVVPVSGILPSSLFALKTRNKDDTGFMGIICPKSQAKDAGYTGVQNIIAVDSLSELVDYFRSEKVIPKFESRMELTEKFNVDMNDVIGQKRAKRALEIAATGGHHMLLKGPPGAGKSMLVERLITILPPLTRDEILELSMIYSLAGVLKNTGLQTVRPFRSIHHTASNIALVGGGPKATIGEITLAHNGILFLDELPEFQRSTLEILRQPLESGEITISRAQNKITYPCNFQLITAMNPCPCGYFGDPKKQCRKIPMCAEIYQSKISGPLLDRIDIHCNIEAVKPWASSSEEDRGDSSSIIRKRVVLSRKMQYDRSQKLYGVDILNSKLSQKQIEKMIIITSKQRELLSKMCEKIGVSARGYFRILKMARTIADIELSDNITEEHLLEAVSYRISSFN